MKEVVRKLDTRSKEVGIKSKMTIQSATYQTPTCGYAVQFHGVQLENFDENAGNLRWCTTVLKQVLRLCEAGMRT